MRAPVVLSALGLCALACRHGLGPRGPAPAVVPATAVHLDLEEARASLTAANRALSLAIQRDGIVTALGDAFATDVFFLSPGMPVIQGATAAKSFLATNPSAPTAMRWDVLRADVSSDGTHGYAWTRGFYTINLGSGAAESPGLFLIYWRRGATDAWRVAGLTFNVRARETPAIPDGFGASSSTHRPDAPNTDVVEERSALLAADAAFAALSVSRGAGEAFATFAAPDAIISNAGVLVFGPAAIREARALNAGDVLSWTPRFSDGAASGDLGFTVGDGTFLVGKTGGNYYSKYLTVWRKQHDGAWKFVADYGSSRPAPASPAPP